jgi:hypothetical protein
MPPVAQPEGKSYAVEVRRIWCIPARGMPVRKWPAILREFTGMEVTQSALTQNALKKSEGVVGNAYQELRTGVATAPAVYTDDAGGRIHGQAADWMSFDTDLATVVSDSL